MDKNIAHSFYDTRKVSRYLKIHVILEILRYGKKHRWFWEGASLCVIIIIERVSFAEKANFKQIFKSIFSLYFRPSYHLCRFIFCMWMSSCSSIICWKDCLCFVILSFLLCQRSVNNICMGLFLGPLFRCCLSVLSQADIVLITVAL